MRILYHHRTRAQGVEGTHIFGMIGGFRELGHKVVIIAPSGTDVPKKIQTTDVPSKKLWNFVSLKAPEIFFEILAIAYNLFSYSQMKKLIRYKNYDFIYERYAYFGLSGSLISKKARIPIIMEVNIVSTLEDVRKIRLRKLAKKIEDIIFRKVDAIVTVSAFLKEHLIIRGVDPKRIWVLPNATDPLKFSPKGKGNELRIELRIGDHIIVGFIGRFIPWYNLAGLIEGFKDIARLFPEIYLLLIGDGVIKPNIETLIKYYNLTDRILMPGWIDHEEAPDYIDIMDIALIPDSNSWGSPMKLFEYMAMGKPVVAPSYQPIGEIIQSGINGLLFHPNDGFEMWKAILSLAKDEMLRKKIGENARKTILQNHTWVKNAERILLIYYTIVKNFRKNA